MQLSTSLASEVLGISRRRLENLLLALRGRLVAPGKQGKSRGIAMEQLELLTLVLLLQRDMGLSAMRAFPLASEISRSEYGVARLGALGSFHFDLPRLRSVLQQALASAVEHHEAPRRGRPVGTK